MNRGAGFQKRVRPEDGRDVRMAVVSTEGITAVCSCKGWTYSHQRSKVREDAVDRHLAKRHHGRGLRV